MTVHSPTSVGIGCGFGTTTRVSSPRPGRPGGADQRGPGTPPPTPATFIDLGPLRGKGGRDVAPRACSRCRGRRTAVPSPTPGTRAVPAAGTSLVAVARPATRTGSVLVSSHGRCLRWTRVVPCRKNGRRPRHSARPSGRRGGTLCSCDGGFPASLRLSGEPAHRSTTAPAGRERRGSHRRAAGNGSSRPSPSRYWSSWPSGSVHSAMLTCPRMADSRSYP